MFKAGGSEGKHWAFDVVGVQSQFCDVKDQVIALRLVKAS
jgi:hypothetical protein